MAAVTGVPAAPVPAHRRNTGCSAPALGGRCAGRAGGAQLPQRKGAALSRHVAQREVEVAHVRVEDSGRARAKRRALVPVVSDAQFSPARNLVAHAFEEPGCAQTAAGDQPQPSQTFVAGKVTKQLGQAILGVEAGPRRRKRRARSAGVRLGCPPSDGRSLAYF